ncbi:MAG TPA: LytTR family DNA-binding domain-containing protein [Candidatus Polarisedimenticolia bacterium]|nr:LytTR family DNA-binding domain-containing protein [Candidatus Polarisedimenticolia bacterium]
MNDSIRCLVVDDEVLAREAIRAYVHADPGLEIVGEAADGPSAVQEIERLRPDLVFLDIQMPEMDGFQVLQRLAERSCPLPLTIFVTAYDSHALRAFEAHALDYLLKPLREERFRDAVLSARSRIAAERGSQVASQLADFLAGSNFLIRRTSRLPIKEKGRIFFLQLDQVEWIESEGNYVRLHLGGESHLHRQTLQALEAELDPSQFMRIHRSVIINILRIKDLRPWFTGEYIVRMLSGKELTVTRTYRDNLRRLLGKGP